jgi:hypothetical protein
MVATSNQETEILCHVWRSGYRWLPFRPSAKTRLRSHDLVKLIPWRFDRSNLRTKFGRAATFLGRFAGNQIGHSLV